jgi:NAD dependent epimerase/dehydratase family enzyme
MLKLVKFGMGGKAGDGKQYISWIHGEDFARAVRWLIEHDEIEGPVNIAAPNPLPNAEFMKVLRSTWGVPFGLPAFEWMLELGAVVIKTETELILKSRRVIATKLMGSGFTFNFPTWPEAAADLGLHLRWNGQSH